MIGWTSLIKERENNSPALVAIKEVPINIYLRLKGLSRGVKYIDTMDGWDGMHVRMKKMYRWMNGHDEGN